MKKTFKVVMLPTEKAINKGDLILLKHTTRSTLHTASELANEISKETGDIIGQHLYFLSDEEIKEGDWTIAEGDKRPIQFNNKAGIDAYNKGVKDGKPFVKIKKISYTTDDSIISHNGPHRIPERIILEYVDSFNKGTPIDQIRIDGASELLKDNL